ncbi:MAG: GGDEF domain-containing protein, partial [Rubrivivax sp.]|nr:GGDEF domain-containing protein [Rubrivivax sp.]
LAARGVALFVRRRPHDLEHFGILVAAGAGSALMLVNGIDMRWMAVLANAPIAWIALRIAALAAGALRTEFGRAGALACAAPMALVGLMLGARALGAVAGAEFALPLDNAGAGQTAVLLGFIVAGLMAHAGFGGMVVLRLVMRLRHASLHDPLTGLTNRRGFEAALATEHARLRRGGRPYALLAIDADHFKRVNDQHGHAGGDQALRHLAQRLRAVARGGDLVARVGGEEFMMLLPETDRAGAHQAAARLLSMVRDTPVPLPEGALRMTVSVGLALAQGGSETLPTLWRRADEALYAAKAAGRDRVVDDEAAVA